MPSGRWVMNYSEWVGPKQDIMFMKQKKNHNIFGGDVYFPRFFHGTPDGVLMNHFYRGGPVYAAPLKAVECDKEDGTLRLVWWRGNEALKAIPLPVRWERPSEAADVSANDNRPTVRWLANPIEMNQTTVLEATLQMPSGDDAFHSIRMKYDGISAACYAWLLAEKTGVARYWRFALARYDRFLDNEVNHDFHLSRPFGLLTWKLHQAGELTGQRRERARDQAKQRDG